MRFSHKLHIRSAPFQLCLALSARSSLPSLSCACRCRAVGLAFRKGTQHTSTLSLLMRSLFNSSAVSHKTGAWDATFGHHPLSHCCEVASLDGYLGSTPSCLQHTLSETTCHVMTSPPTHHAIWSATFFLLGGGSLQTLQLLHSALRSHHLLERCHQNPSAAPNHCLL